VRSRTGLAVGLFAAAIAPAVSAADPTVCDDTRIAPPTVTPYPQYGPRNVELWLSAGELGDWASRGSMTPAFVLGAELGVPFDVVQRVRLAAGASAVFGHWGDDAHSLVGLETRLDLRASYFMDDLLDLYVLARPIDVMFGWNEARAAYRPGVGLGVRVARRVELEGTLDGIVALGSAFAGGERAGPGMTLSLGFDTCLWGWCNRSAPQNPAQTSLTCALYDEARSACPSSGGCGAMCNAVAAAMDASRPSIAEGARARDAIDAFLLGVAQQLSGDVKDRIDHLRATHDALLRKLLAAQTDEREAEQVGTGLVDHCSYAPTAIELRDALGCTPEGAPMTPARPTGCDP
jgi:hypothetical protein